MPSRAQQGKWCCLLSGAKTIIWTRMRNACIKIAIAQYEAMHRVSAACDRP